MLKFIFKVYKRAIKFVNSFKVIREILAMWNGGVDYFILMVDNGVDKIWEVL